MNNHSSVVIVAVILIVTGMALGTLNATISNKISSDISQPVSNSGTATAAGNQPGSNQTGPAQGIPVSDDGGPQDPGGKKPVKK